MKCALEEKIKERFILNQDIFPTSVEENDERLRSLCLLLPIKGKILDVGCGKGRFIKEINRYNDCTFYGVDITPPFVEYCKEQFPNFIFKISSATNLSFKREFFDAVYCVQLLEHIPNPQIAVNEILRVLKPGGIIILIEKNYLSIQNVMKITQELKGTYSIYHGKFPFREHSFSDSELRKMIKDCVNIQQRHVTIGKTH